MEAGVLPRPVPSLLRVSQTRVYTLLSMGISLLLLDGYDGSVRLPLLIPTNL
jgi:hypothetical protein